MGLNFNRPDAPTQTAPAAQAELEQVIEKRIRKNTPIRNTTNKTAKKKQEK